MEKELQLLYSRLHKLDERGFDLNSWKQGTVAVINSILGPGNHKVKLIEGIDFQNNSWSLRDTTGDVDSVKKTCADVLETIILEIETLGLAEKTVPLEKSKNVDSVKLVEEALKKELSQSELNDLMALLQKAEVGSSDVVDKFKRFGYEVAPKVLASILLSPEFKKSI